MSKPLKYIADLVPASGLHCFSGHTLFAVQRDDIVSVEVKDRIIELSYTFWGIGVVKKDGSITNIKSSKTATIYFQDAAAAVKEMERYIVAQQAYSERRQQMEILKLAYTHNPIPSGVNRHAVADRSVASSVSYPFPTNDGRSTP